MCVELGKKTLQELEARLLSLEVELDCYDNESDYGERGSDCRGHPREEFPVLAIHGAGRAPRPG
jgi:hypothetical protein